VLDEVEVALELERGAFAREMMRSEKGTET
jgi:hypothetical protein